MRKSKNLSLYLPFNSKGKSKSVKSTRAKMVAVDSTPTASAEVIMPMSDILADREKNVRDDHRRGGEDSGGYGDIAELATDFGTNGQLQAVSVRPSPATPGKFELVFGFRRYAAAKKLGWKSLRATVIAADDAAIDWMRLRENEARRSLSSYEKSKAYCNQHVAHKWGLQEIAEKAGIDKSTVENHVRIFKSCIPDVLDRYRVGQFNNTITLGLASCTKEQQADFVEGVGTRAGSAATAAWDEFKALDYKWGGPGEEGAGEGDGKGEPAATPASERPGKATLGKALAWAKENEFADCKLVLEWALGKRVKLVIDGEAFDPDAEKKAASAEKAAAKAAAEKAAAEKAKK